MVFRVILRLDGQYKSTLFRSTKIESVYKRYHKLLEENNTVLFPKKYVNHGKIKPVKYEISVTKITEEGDKFRLLRDDVGKSYTEPQLGDWTILVSSEYNFEETFWLFGKSPVNERVTIHDIIKPLMKDMGNLKTTKQIIVVHNKLLLYNENQFDMVICKCKKDAQRLHHALAKAVKNNNIKNLLFMGTATQASITRLYELIKEKTGWPMSKVYRRTTRP
jgi:hypothetical protein